MTAPLMDCAVCHRPLNFAEGKGYLHPLAKDDDHIAVPVARGTVEVLYRCDFCGADLEPANTWVIPARQFTMPHGDISVGDWSACPLCAAMVKADHWQQLANRVIGSLPPEARRLQPDRVTRKLLSAMYLSLHFSMTGPPRRMYP